MSRNWMTPEYSGSSFWEYEVDDDDFRLNLRRKAARFDDSERSRKDHLQRRTTNQRRQVRYAKPKGSR